MKKVIVGMSGGVDSSVSAYLLKKQGYKVEGLFMKNWEEENNKTLCSSSIDFSDAQLVCDKLNIKLNFINFSKEYLNKVFKVFINEYTNGYTPNPDVLCNKEIKFKLFLDFSINKLKADYIATGHYARRKKINGNYNLLKAIDLNKDQSYFLYNINQYQLKHTIFPIGNFKKIFIRKIAKKINLINFNKKDSVGICFIGKRKFKNFIKKFISQKKPGAIVTTEGKIIGKHKGLIYYTIGQRKGLKIGGIKNTNNQPWYVVNKNIKNHTITVAQGINNTHLMSSGCIVEKIHWIIPLDFNKEIQCCVKTRYRQQDIKCKIILDKKYKKIMVIFNNYVSSVAPGQSAVFYKNEICLGGGIIRETF